MRRILIATGNTKKGRELAEILGSTWSVSTLKDLAVVPEIVEDGLTFQENAVKKALTVAQVHEGLILADDSGLEVDALSGAPGVRSARFAGEPSNDARNNTLLLEKLQGLPVAKRGAQFHCVLALVEKGSLLKTFSGICRGQILNAPGGDGGFGYDPLFVPDGYSQTFAELPAATKHQLSHRGQAMRQLLSFLNDL